MPIASLADAKLRGGTRSLDVCWSCIAMNSPTAQAETKHTTSAYENSLCQFQLDENVVSNMVVKKSGLADRPGSSVCSYTKAEPVNASHQREGVEKHVLKLLARVDVVSLQCAAGT